MLTDVWELAGLSHDEWIGALWKTWDTDAIDRESVLKIVEVGGGGSAREAQAV